MYPSNELLHIKERKLKKLLKKELKIKDLMEDFDVSTPFLISKIT